MKLYLNDFLYAFSMALDEVEHQLVGATSRHAQRVAYLCSRMGETLGLSTEERMDLAMAALLHDNALTEFIQSELLAGTIPMDVKLEKALGRHCVMGEANVRVLPGYERIKDAILYHHERVDRQGPFHKTTSEVPLYACLIHLADMLDVTFDLNTVQPEDIPELRSYIKSHTGTYFGNHSAQTFLNTLRPEDLPNFRNEVIVDSLKKSLPSVEVELNGADLVKFAEMFAKIIDCKSPFTCRHSVGLAEKAQKMGEFYGWDKETCDKLYFAGAVHDLGKLMVNNDLLEKPGKLTPEEYEEVQEHAMGSYVVLSQIRGLEEVTKWAVHHHEKLNGTGYPFGLRGDMMGREERLMACLDIYQALVEPRPYKDGLSHDVTMGILRKMVATGQLDGTMVEDINACFALA